MLRFGAQSNTRHSVDASYLIMSTNITWCHVFTALGAVHNAPGLNTTTTTTNDDEDEDDDDDVIVRAF